MLTSLLSDGAARRRIFGLAALAGSTALVGCDLEVVNPGPIDDSFLEDPAAFAAIVNGVSRNLNWTMNVIAMDTGIRTREIHLTDVNDWNSQSFPAHMGYPNTDAPNYLNPWGNGQAARWIGEDFLRRAAEVLSEDEFRRNAVVARGHLWAGYANRAMGDYYCEAVFDGGPALPGDEFLKRAEQVFTGAIEIGTASGATEVATAGRAGRASVRIHLGDWAGAVEDAGHVPTNFEFALPFYTDGDWRYYNSLAYSTSYTVWNTPYADYFEQANDPRTPWEADDPLIAPSTVAPWTGTGIPHLIQRKYTEWGDPIRLSSGAEMRLVEAEGFLRQGNIDSAMERINGLRDRVGVARWPAPASIDEAWSLLKRERGIELWLEGRRLADLKRWKATSTPGALDPHEMGMTNGGPDLSNRALCIPVPDIERDRNPNL